MTKYVIGPDVALRLAQDEAALREDHQFLVPTLLLSQILSLLYQAVRRGEMAKNDADRQLNYVRSLRIRLSRRLSPTERGLQDRRPAQVARYTRC